MARSQEQETEPQTATVTATPPPQPGRGTLGVGMVGYAFMGAAHSQGWRTAGRAVLAWLADPEAEPWH
ncbi:hypothetical protein AB0O63_34215, partial [Streptomyces cyaneofuscatus]